MKAPRTQFELCPQDTFSSICYGYWAIGIQKTEYKAVERFVNQVVLGFELNTRIREGELEGKRHRLYKRITFTMGKAKNGNPSTLRKMIVSWEGKEFDTEDQALDYDLDNILGKPCQITVIHGKRLDGGTKAEIDDVRKLGPGMEAITAEFDTSPPEWVVKLMNESSSPIPNQGGVQETLKPVEPVEGEKRHPLLEDDDDDKEEEDEINF